jgi:myo-inositol-1(or 4)-monophosphatase
MLEKIKNIIKQAGYLARQDYDKSVSTITHKGNIDLVTETDLKLEQFLKEEILKIYPDHYFLIEESDDQLKSVDHLWIIDPLDGTTNFAHRFPIFAISIAYERYGEVVLGVVYVPKLDELFWAEKGSGAFLNGERITCSTTDKISNSLIATGFPYDRWEKGDFYLQEYAAFMKRSQGIRRAGAAAVDLCYTACGRLDGFFEHKLKPWDTAAGCLIVNEAGGRITDYQGNSRHYSAITIIASNGKIHPEMIEILAQAHQGNIN